MLSYVYPSGSHIFFGPYFQHPVNRRKNKLAPLFLLPPFYFNPPFSQLTLFFLFVYLLSPFSLFQSLFQILRCKDDPAYRRQFAEENGIALSKRADDLTQFAHRAKQEERSEYVLIAKQVMRFRQLRNSCENELARGHEWQQHRDHDPPVSPQSMVGSTTSTVSTSNNSPTPKNLTGSQVVNTHLGRSRPGKTEEWKEEKHRRGSTSTTKKRLSSPVAMIRNRLRGASYHHGKMNFAKLFSYYDRDNSGQIDKAEFISLVRRDGKILISAMSNQLLGKVFDNEVDVNGDGDITHDEFEAWIMKDYEVKKKLPHPDDVGQPMDTFTRLFLSAPKYTSAIQKDQSPRQRRQSLNTPESGGDFRAILRGGDNSETAKAWRQNYHTKVDTKTSEYPVLYDWEKKGQSQLTQSFGSMNSGERKFASPVTESAKKAKEEHYMGNIEKLRQESKNNTFKNEKLQLAFGRRIPKKEEPKKSPSKEEKKIQKEKEQTFRPVASFSIVLTAEEFELYKRLQMAIPVEQDHYQAVSGVVWW